MSNNIKFVALSKLGAGDFEHLSGNLEDHLNKTCDLLSQWGAGDELKDAGLYHAAYGTAGFDSAMVDTSQRTRIANIIGERAEKIVYTYCACDRTIVWPCLDGSHSVKFRDRFEKQTGLLEGHDLKNFCELTIANEVQIAMDNEEFGQKNGPFFRELVHRLGQNLSHEARLAAAKIFAG